MRGKNNANVMLVLVLISSSAFAQDTLQYPGPQNLDFLSSDDNIIHNSVSLSLFFDKLYALKKGTASRVNIIHLGDSHIQADFLSGQIRESFHRDFGNGGRGLIVPGRVARTNEPFSIVTSSPTPWEVKRVVLPNLPLPIGISGITIRSTQPLAKLSIRTLNTPMIDYGFNKVTLFFQKDFSSFNLVVQDSVQHELAFFGSYTFETIPNVSTVQLPAKTNLITLQCLAPTGLQKQLVLFGVDLENGKPGVLYHAIGVNGAKYKHYTLATLFSEQTAALQPDLFIVSLGTNEALDYPYNDPTFTSDIDKLLESIKAKNPNVRFVLTTPADGFRRRTRRNPGVEIVRQKIIDYAETHNVAYWDLYAASGGKRSADLWKQNKLLRADGIHFSAVGYELQGNMLYDALMKSYNEYVRYRHP